VALPALTAPANGGAALTTAVAGCAVNVVDEGGAGTALMTAMAKSKDDELKFQT
jgi:hypothetical protein